MMMKRIMIIAVTAAAMPLMAAEWYDSSTGYTWKYRIVGGKAEIINYDDYGNLRETAISPSPVGNVTVPSSLGGKTVVSVGDRAFYGCDKLTSVSIPNSVTNIGAYAFRDCSVLSAVTLPTSLKTLGGYCFCECKVLPYVSIPNGVTQIPEYCFADCSSLQSVGLPNSVTVIDDNAFGWYLDGCKSLRKISLPTSLKAIGKEAFEYSGLTEIVIPNGVGSIGKWAFYGCDTLKSVWMDDSVISIGESAFGACESLRDVRLSKGLTSVAANTFSCSGLESVVIPASVVSLGNGSFNCQAYVSGAGYHYLTNVIFCGNAPAGIDVSKILEHAKSVYYPLTFASSYLEYVDETKFAGYTESLTFDDDPPSAKTYQVVFNVNGGSGTMANQTFTIGTYQALSKNLFVREDYTFLGWSMSASSTSATYSDQQVIKDLTTVSGDTVTLYAIWRANGGGGGGEPHSTGPDNDNFEDAQYLGRETYGSVIASNVNATIENGESNYHDSKKSVWYSWKAPFDGVATFDTLGTFSTCGQLDTVIGAYTGNSIGRLSEVAFNDDADESDYCESKITFYIYQGTTYRIMIGGNGRESGLFLLNWSAVEQDVPPYSVPETNTVTITNYVDVAITNMVSETNFVDVAIAVTNTVTDHVTVTNTVTDHVTVTDYLILTNLVDAVVTNTVVETNFVDVAVAVTNTVTDHVTVTNTVTDHVTVTDYVILTNLVDAVVTNTVVETNFVDVAIVVTNTVTDYVTVTNIIEIAQAAAVVPVEVQDVEPEAEFTGVAAKKMNGIVFDAGGTMRGVIQVETAKASAKGVKVKGFVMLEDGKKVALKAATVPVEDGRLKVETTVGKLGTLSITVGGDGFKGTLGAMKVVSADIGEDAGVLSGSLTLKYIDATGKIKNRKIAIGGVVSDGTAAGTATTKGEKAKVFAAEFE